MRDNLHAESRGGLRSLTITTARNSPRDTGGGASPRERRPRLILAMTGIPKILRKECSTQTLLILTKWETDTSLTSQNRGIQENLGPGQAPDLILDLTTELHLDKQSLQ